MAISFRSGTVFLEPIVLSVIRRGLSMVSTRIPGRRSITGWGPCLQCPSRPIARRRKRRRRLLLLLLLLHHLHIPAIRINIFSIDGWLWSQDRYGIFRCPAVLVGDGDADLQHLAGCSFVGSPDG